MTKVKKTKQRYTLFAILLLFIIFLFIGLNQSLIVRRYEIESEKVTQQVRLALITDLHSCLYGENQAQLVAAIDAQAPDVILFGGDICDDEIPHENTETLLQAIADRYPCYYVTGNHEIWTWDLDNVLAIFRRYGVTVLDGSYETVEINGQKLNICGVGDPATSFRTQDSQGMIEKLDTLANVAENGNFTLLLSHRPEWIETYLMYDFDLILSGHAHGGQWRLPGLINGLFAPNQGLFPAYAGGRYDFEKATFIVSRGLATTSTRIPRIFNRPELVIIDVT